MAEIDNKHEVNDSIDISIKTDNEISTSLIEVSDNPIDGLTDSVTAERLGKNHLVAYQASRRGGVLDCVVAGDRVIISGHAVQYMTGFITIEES